MKKQLSFPEIKANINLTKWAMMNNLNSINGFFIWISPFVTKFNSKTTNSHFHID